MTSWVLGGRPVMASVVARTARTSYSWSSVFAGIRSSVGESSPSSMSQYRSYFVEGVDGRVISSPAATDPLHRQFSPCVSRTPTCGLATKVSERNAFKVSHQFNINLSPTALKEDECPDWNLTRASGNVAQGSCHDSPGHTRKEPPKGSACRREDLQMPSGCMASEAIALLQHRQQQGLSIDSYMLVEVLKRCSIQRDLIAIRQVHDYILQSGMQKQRYVATTLMTEYIKCGRLQDARQFFDRLERTHRTVIIWNVIIGAYAKSGCGVEAYRLFHQMKREGFKPDAFTYASMLNAPASAGALEWVKEVHGHAHRGGLESDVRVANALVRIYAKSGSIDSARVVFDRMEKRNVISWTMIIGAYAESGLGIEAYGLFLQMKREGFEPNAITYLSILNPSAKSGALEWVKDVHVYARRTGLESDLRVANALVHMYAKSGSVDDARQCFDQIKKRDVVTWNIIIGAYAEIGHGMEAYGLFLQMKREGFDPNGITYMNILNPTASLGALEWVKDVHGHARGGGLETNMRVGSALVHMYAKSGSINDARLVFDRMEKRDVVTWNIVIGAYAESGFGEEAYRLLLRMKREGFTLDAFTYANILNAPANTACSEWVKEVHNHVRNARLESDLRVGSALVHIYAGSGSIDDARHVFDRMEKRDVVTWNIMIKAYAERGRGAEAYGLFLQMKREGFEPNAITYISILNASANAGALEWVEEVHRHALKQALESNLLVGSAFLHMYAKSGSIDDARVVFERMEKRDVLTWTAMIGALAQHGCGHEALKLFGKMNADSVKPDGATFVALLTACSHAGLVEDGRRLFLAMKQDYGVLPSVVHYTCMVDLLGRAGHLEEAKNLVETMPVEPDAVTWICLLGACRMHCNVELGEFAAKEALKLDPKDAAAYVLLSNIYAAIGMWEKVFSVRKMMEKSGARKEPGRSWIEVDNKTHEFVVGDRSHPEATAIYRELHVLTEKLKAKGYIPDTKLVLHNIDEEDKELALCSHSEKLAIAYGLLRVPHGDAIRVKKNLRVCSDCHAATKVISEVTGREIIVRDAIRFHHFKDGVCSCGDYW